MPDELVKYDAWKARLEVAHSIEEVMAIKGMADGAASNRAHYALICRTESAIDKDPVGELDATALVNIRSGRPVGYSQVTSVVALNGSAASQPMHYPVTFKATLFGAGQVRLTDCIEISADDVAVELVCTKQVLR